jgi:hypothetical protein
MPTPRIFNDLRGSVTLLVVAAVGIVAALAIGDALRSGRSSSAAGTAPTTTPAPTTDTALPPTLTSTPEVARSPNTCGAFRIAPSGDYPLLVVEVVAGDVTCHDARGVMKAHYVGLLRGSWICHGGVREAVGGVGQRALRRHTRRPGMGDGADRQPLGSGLRCARAQLLPDDPAPVRADRVRARRRNKDQKLHAAHNGISEVVRESEGPGDRDQRRAGRGEVLERRADRARWGRREQVVGSQGRRERRPQGLRVARNGYGFRPTRRATTARRSLCGSPSGVQASWRALSTASPQLDPRSHGRPGESSPPSGGQNLNCNHLPSGLQVSFSRFGGRSCG